MISVSKRTGKLKKTTTTTALINKLHWSRRNIYPSLDQTCLTDLWETPALEGNILHTDLLNWNTLVLCTMKVSQTA